jgi:hypothetical protein
LSFNEIFFPASYLISQKIYEHKRRKGRHNLKKTSADKVVNVESVRFQRVRRRRSALLAGSRDTKCGRPPPTLHLAPEFELATGDVPLAEAKAWRNE